MANSLLLVYRSDRNIGHGRFLVGIWPREWYGVPLCKLFDGGLEVKFSIYNNPARRITGSQRKILNDQDAKVYQALLSIR